jgi:hypothetical protein
LIANLARRGLSAESFVALAPGDVYRAPRHRAPVE